EHGEEILERRVPGVFPVELLIVALKESEFAEKAEFRLGRKGDVTAGCVVDPAELEKTGGESPAAFLGMRAGPHQQPSSSRGREGYRDLELRVVAAAGAGKRFRPAGIEHVFTARVALEVAGRGGEEGPVRRLHQQMLRLPPRSATDRFRGF